MAGGIFVGSVYATMELQTGGFVGDIARSQSALGAFDKAAINSTGALGNWSGKANAAFNQVADGISGLVKTTVALGITGGLGIATFVRTASELQTTSRQFGILIGNTEQANKVFGELYNFTLGKPIAFPDASKAAATLLGFGRTAQQIMPDMKTLSTLSIVNGADLQALAVVFGQVTSRGALFGQDALQLISNRIPLTTILARKFGITMEEAAGKINGGTVSAKEFTEAMTEYANSLDISSMSDTFKNRMISLQGSVRSFGLTILGLKIDPIKGLVVESGGLFDRLSQGIADLGPKLKELAPIVKDAFTFLLDHSAEIAAGVAAIFAVFAAAKIGAFVTSFAGVAGGFLALTGAITPTTAAMLGFDAAVTANPIGAIVVGILALVGALTYLQVKFDIFGKIGDALNTVKGYINDNKAAFVAFGVAALAIFGPFLASIIATAAGFVAMTVATTAWSVVTKLAAAGQWLLNAALTANPIGLIIAAIALLVGAFLLLWKNNEGFRNFFIAMWDGIKAAFSAVVGFFKDNFNTIKTVILTVLAVAFAPLLLAIGAGILIFKALQAAVGFLAGVFTTVFNAIKTAVTTVFTAIMTVWTTVLKPVFDAIVFVVTSLFTIWVTIWTGIIQVIMTVVTTIVQIIGVILYGIVLFIYNSILLPIWNFFTSVWNAIYTTVSTIVTTIVTWITDRFNEFMLGVQVIFNAIKDFFTTIWNAIYNFIAPIVQSIIDFVMQRWENLKANVTWVFNAVKDFLVNTWNSIKNTVVNTVTGLYNAVRDKFNDVKTAVGDAISGAWDKLKEYVQKFLDTGKDIINGLVKGIQNGKDAVVQKVKEIAAGALDAVKSFFGIKSPSRVMAKMGGFLSQGFANGIDDMGGAAVNAAAQLAKSVLSEFNSMPQNPLNTSGFGTIKPGNYSQTAAQMGISPSKIETNFYGPVDASNRGDEGRVMGTIARNEELAEKGIVSAAQGVSL